MTIAGSDPSGGAGIQADLKTFAALGCYGQAVITALTVQNTQGVKSSVPVPASLIFDQAHTVMEDWMPSAVKIGMVPDAECAQVLVSLIETHRPHFVVFDPVMVSTSGLPLVAPEAVSFIRDRLMPLCSLITPNLPEARVLCNAPEADATTLAGMLEKRLGGTAVLVKGGHADGDVATDVLACDHRLYPLTAERIATPNSHGTGCVLSSAIAAHRALGLPLPEAVGRAKEFLTHALRTGADYETGKGNGPLFLWNDHKQETERMDDALR